MICPECNNELHDDAKFCPYCMTKIEEVQEYKVAKVNGKKYGAIVGVMVLIVVAAIVGVIVAGKDRFGNDDEKLNEVKGNATATAKVDEEVKEKNEEKEETLEELDKEDEWKFEPLTYCGTWYNKDFTGEDPALEGGIVLNVISINDKKIIFDLFSYQEPPQSRVAEIYNIEADIVDKKAEFVFRDDGWGNGGLGTIIFLKDSLCISIKLTTISSDSLWTLVVDNEFKKVSEDYENDSIDFSGLIGVNIELLKDKMKGIGCELEEGPYNGAYQYEGVVINTVEGEVVSIYVDYTIMEEGFRDTFNFSARINGRTEYEYLKQRFGEPVLVSNDFGIYRSTFNFPEDNDGMKTALDFVYVDGYVLYIMYYNTLYDENY